MLPKPAARGLWLSTGSEPISGDANGLRAHKLGIEVRFAVLQEHREDLHEVGLQLLHIFALAMRPPKSWDMADEQARLDIAFDDRCV